MRGGEVIDGHSAVLRLNAAPTGGKYARHVGRRTHLRLLNAAKVGERTVLLHTLNPPA